MKGLRLTTPVARQKWQIAHDQIKLGKKLGAGAFGEVFRGNMRVGKNTQMPVAIKVNQLINQSINLQTLRIKGVVTKADRQTFVSEARIMRKYTHPNVVQLIGIAAAEQPIMLVLEFCQGELID